MTKVDRRTFLSLVKKNVTKSRQAKEHPEGSGHILITDSTWLARRTGSLLFIDDVTTDDEV